MSNYTMTEFENNCMIHAKYHHLDPWQHVERDEALYMVGTIGARKALMKFWRHECDRDRISLIRIGDFKGSEMFDDPAFAMSRDMYDGLRVF